MKVPMLTCAFLVAFGCSILPVRAQSLNQLGVDRLNADAQSLWANDGLPMARQEAWNQLQKLVGIPHQVNSKTTATITRINSVTIDCPGAPGMTRLDTTRIEARLPLQGSWRIAASADLYVKGKILLIPVDRTYTINIEVKDFWASLRMDVDSSDMAAPRVAHLYPPVANFNLKVTTSSWVMNFLLWLTRSTVNDVADGLTQVGSSYLSQKLNQQFMGAPEVWQGNVPGLAPVAPANLEAAALKIEDQTHSHKMPFGTCLTGHFTTPYYGTWEDSVNDPGFDLGPVDLGAMGFGGNSVDLTGFHLAGLAFRHAATGSAAAQDRAREVLRSLRTCLTMRGEPGNLNRTIWPYHPGENLGNDWYVQNYQGVDYVMSDYISRDNYMGVFLGLSVAYDHLTDPQLKDEARQLLEMAIDYLLAHNWTWRKRDGSLGERWAGSMEHQYAFVLAAYRVNPAKYAAVLQAYKGYADLLWVGVWSGCLDTYYSYYKFDLVAGVLYMALSLETDPGRWQRAYQGMAILRRYVGHHQNAHFNNCYLATTPSLVSSLGAENKNLLTRFVRRPRRNLTFNLTQDPTIEKVTYTVPFDTNLLFPGQGVPNSVVIAKYPIPVEKRLGAGYLWSHTPYELHSDTIWGPEPGTEGCGVDYTLPYWMARYYRAIPTPRVPVTTSAAPAAAPRGATAR